MAGAEAAAKSGGSGDRIAQVAPGGDDATGAAPGQPKARTAFEGKEYTIVPRAGHSSEIHSVAFSPDGRLALTGSEDNTAKMWDVPAGRELRTLEGHAGAVTSVAFSPDGRLVLTGSNDETAKLWEVATGRVLQTLTGHSDWITSVAFSPDGRLALTGSGDGSAKLWEVATGRELRTLAGHGNVVEAVAFSPDGRLVLTGADDNTAKLWDVAAGRELRTLAGHSRGVNAVAFSPDGRLALTGSWDTTAKLWEVATGRELRTLSGHSGQVHSVAFSSDGRLALTGATASPGYASELAGGTAKIWQVATGRELRTLTGRLTRIRSVALSPDGQVALTATGWNAMLWEATTGRKLLTLAGHSGEVTSVAFSPDGRLALTGSEDNTAKLWEVATGRQMRALGDHDQGVTSVAFSPDGLWVLTGSWDGTVRLWEISTGNWTLVGRTDDHHAVYSVALSPDGRLALTGFIDGAKLWEVATGRELRTLPEYWNTIWSVAFSPDGRLALTGSQFREEFGDGTAILWEVATGRELRILKGHSAGVPSVAFSPDGRLALTGSSDRTAKLWDVATGRELRTLSGHSNTVWSVAFLPDGRLALTGSWDGTAKLWEVATGRLVRTMISMGDAGWISLDGDGEIEALAGDPNELYSLVSGTEVLAPSEAAARGIALPEPYVVERLADTQSGAPPVSVGKREIAGPEAVWNWDDLLGRGDVKACLRDAGAPDEAIAFVRAIEDLGDDRVFLAHFEEYGPVDLAEVGYPTRANTNAVYFMVNGDPPAVSTEDERVWRMYEEDIRLRRFAQQHDGAFLIGKMAAGGLQGHRWLPGGGQRFVFVDFLAQCRGCELLGEALFAFDFDADGVFQGVWLMAVMECGVEGCELGRTYHPNDLMRQPMLAQRRLVGLGYPLGLIDGAPGPKTRAAIRAFQAEHGLAETGGIDQATAMQLATAGDVAPAPASAETRRVIVHQEADYYGFDYEVHMDVGLGECRSACLADPRCRAFTHNSKARACFLKSQSGELTPFAGAVAGQVVEVEPSVEPPPSATLPTVSDEAMEETLIIETPSGPVKINNVFINPDYKPPPPQDWGVGVRRTPRYHITFFTTEKEWFLISLIDTCTDVRVTRRDAEQEFLKILDILPGDACKLVVRLHVSKDISYDLAGSDYGLSFCPDGTPF
jgi:WD40 repeat protein